MQFNETNIPKRNKTEYVETYMPVPSSICSMPIYPLQRVFYPQNRPCTSKIVGTFYMQGYKVKEKTAIVPPVSKLSGHPGSG
jgi:hypothetical protein